MSAGLFLLLIVVAVVVRMAIVWDRNTKENWTRAADELGLAATVGRFGSRQRFRGRSEGSA